MRDCFLGLRHDAVVSSHDQNHDVGNLGATGTHGGKCLMTWCIEKGDDALWRRHMVRADMLGNAASFASGNACATDGIEQRGLAVVDVAHDGNHRRARLHVRLGMNNRVGQIRLGIITFGSFGHVAEFTDENHRRFLIQHLVDRHHRAHLHHNLDHFSGLHCHLLREFADGNGFRHQDFSNNRFGGRLKIGCCIIIVVAILTPPTAPAIAAATGIAARLDAASFG